MVAAQPQEVLDLEGEARDLIGLVGGERFGQLLLELRQLNLEVRLELGHVPPSSPALPPDPAGRCERPDD